MPAHTQNLSKIAKIAPVLAVRAPAKLNLHLAVKDRRADGLHNLESIFLSLAFWDTLYFEPACEEKLLEISMEKEKKSGNLADFFALPAEKNIIFKAVSCFRDKTGFNRGLRIRVKKRIPVGGGLGGGSSDAASTLLALNRLAGGILPLCALAEMAESLGSDVPFFLHEAAAAWVSGRGEFIDPIEAPKGLFFVLVNPGFPSETARAFRLLSDFREGQATACGGNSGHGEKQLLLNALSGDPQNWPFKNDFLPAFLHLAKGSSGGGSSQNAEKAYLDIFARLKELGAVFSGLSGAGSTCFGVFTKMAEAKRACKILLETWDFVKLTFPSTFYLR